MNDRTGLGLGRDRQRQHAAASASWESHRSHVRSCRISKHRIQRAPRQAVYMPQLPRAGHSLAAENPRWTTRPGGLTRDFPRPRVRPALLPLWTSPGSSWNRARRPRRNLARSSCQVWKNSDLDSSYRNHSTYLLGAEERKKGACGRGTFRFRG